ncbi:MAG: GGDEF domain-containing protein [Arcobacter sp.]|jgi:diguanylate cyclase (GGDEF)-like protein|uniref:GGDEF domain-containing protein n=1 Tax=Arcobacter sp. TaxID=1872629 RepID=UPI002591090D|nr:GGDEF domain-containing protein [Arcobacter sp.]MDD3008512.1 GGDEF domain-containing protein [Arcobacter sp.]MDY3204167.1 GGDEF domain-containing protein [Arcobacter sp.]
MNLSCETIINENEKLKLSDLEKSCLNIFDYLNLHHKIELLKIDIKKNEKVENLFSSCDSQTDYFINTLSFKQNCDTEVIFSFLSKTQEEYESIKENLNFIKLSLQIFSQSLYNKYMEKTLSEMSLVDHVTGSYNRCYLNNYVGNLLSLSNREQKKIAFVKIAIDQFKAVIDEFDYEIGDKVLKALAQTLKNSVRESDIVIKISNDEFLIILLNIINENNAILTTEKLINNFSKEKVLINEETNQVLMKTICGGISIYPDNATTIEEIIKKSDIALYEAKNRGRGQVFLFNEEDTNKIDFF